MREDGTLDGKKLLKYIQELRDGIADDYKNSLRKGKIETHMEIEKLIVEGKFNASDRH